MNTTHERVVLVTGGTDGIGRAVALRLARGGCTVLVSGRDPERGASVLRELRAASSAREHRFLPADLTLLAETHRLADAVSAASRRVDALVLCAGVLSLVPEWTAEALERAFVLNYLSRFLLVRRLLPRLRDAPAGRVVLVANAGVYPDTLDFEDLQHRRGERGLVVSGRTQFANDLFAMELHERLAGTRVEVACVRPGLTRTSVFRSARGAPRVLAWLAVLLQRLFGQTADTAARTPAFLASEAAVGVGGQFFGARCQRIPVPERARAEDRRAALWRASEALVQRTP